MSIHTYVASTTSDGKIVWVAECPECGIQRSNVVRRHAKSGVAVHRRLEHGIVGEHSKTARGYRGRLAPSAPVSTRPMIGDVIRPRGGAHYVVNGEVCTGNFDVRGFIELLALGGARRSARRAS